MGFLSVRGAALAAAVAAAMSFGSSAWGADADRWAIGHGPVAAATTGGVESPERPPRPPRAAGTPSKPNARAEWFYSQRAYPLPEIPVGALGKAQAQAAAMPEATGALKASSTSPWTLIGPVGFDSRIEPTWGRMSGRVRAIALDPNDGNRILLGTATGGVWLSSNAGQSWTPLTDQMPSLAIGAVAIDPNNANVFYAGSGEANGSYYSAGLYKSTDGGASWQVLAANTFRLGAIASILVDPANSNFVLVCARNGSLLNGGSTGNNIGGVYRSTDGGQSFQQVFNSFCTDLVAVPTNFNVMYTSAVGINDGNGLYRSTDRGQSFSRVEGAVSGSDVGRLAIGLSRDGSRVYIGGDNGNAVVLQRSLDGGTTWSPAVSTPKPDGNSNEPGQAATYCESQCGYDNAIGVDPFDGNVVWLGGIGLFRSGDAMENFARIGSNNTGGGPLHVDHHVVAFHPTVQGLVYNGNDGGIYRSTDGGASWASIGGTLATIQSYHVALHPTDPNILYTGNQDNGTTRRTGNDVWTEINGGDGGYAAVDFANPQIVYSSTTELNFSKSTNGGDTFQPAGFQRAEGEPVGFIAPVVMHPTNSQVLVGGTNRLWLTSDGAANWQPVTEALPVTEGAVISTIVVARGDPQLIYAGASDGTFARFSPEGVGRVRGGSLPERYLTSVAADASNPIVVYATFSGFNEATPSTPGHVFRSSDGGATWTNASGNLPNAPVNAVAIRPGQTQEVYVGTDVGVYITLDGGGSWAKMGNGMPNVAVASMAVNGTTDRLVAATYGRSVWATSLSGSGGGNSNPNRSALYFNSAEAGYAVSITHQDDVLAAAWYTFDPNGRPVWFTSAAPRQPDGRYAGQYFFSTGTPFQNISGSQASQTTEALGSTSFEFAADGRLTFTFTPNGGSAASRNLEALSFVPNPPVCRFTNEPRTGASNYSDLWWNSAESGWGLTIIHQGDGMFVAWYTYAADGQPQWLTSFMTRQADGSFRGRLNRPASGLPYTSTPNGAVTTFPLPDVGEAALAFSDGERGEFAYSLDGVIQSKAIERFAFGALRQVCEP